MQRKVKLIKLEIKFHYFNTTDFLTTMQAFEYSLPYFSNYCTQTIYN